MAERVMAERGLRSGAHVVTPPDQRTTAHEQGCPDFFYRVVPIMLDPRMNLHEMHKQQDTYAVDHYHRYLKSQVRSCRLSIAVKHTAINKRDSVDDRRRALVCSYEVSASSICTGGLLTLQELKKPCPLGT